MSCSEEKKKHDRKKGLLKICYVSEAALTTAAGVFQWMDPAASLLGFTLAKPAVELAKEATHAWCDDVDVEAEYLRAVEEALERTRAHFFNNKSKLAILRELSERVDEIDMDLAAIIERTETFQTQYMTMIDTKEILTEFEHHFSLVVPKYKSLTGFYIIRTGNRTLDLLKRVHIIVEADSSKIENILDYVISIDNLVMPEVFMEDIPYTDVLARSIYFMSLQCTADLCVIDLAEKLFLMEHFTLVKYNIPLHILKK